MRTSRRGAISDLRKPGLGGAPGNARGVQRRRRGILVDAAGWEIPRPRRGGIVAPCRSAGAWDGRWSDWLQGGRAYGATKFGVPWEFLDHPSGL